MKKYDEVNKVLTDSILHMIEVNANETSINERYNIWSDSSMVLTDSEETYYKLIDAFDILGLSFSTGEPDGEGEHYYIDFA